MPQFGSLFLTLFMSAAIHFHVRFLHEPVAKLPLQLALLSASLTVLFLELYEEENAPVSKAKEKTS